nr:ankyrin repeat domain-containing protein [Rickettsia endosymbiont of Ceutorhynchus assimilis]
MQTEKNFTNKTRKRKGNFTGNEELSKKPRKDIYNKTHTPVNNSNQSENYNDVFEDKNILNVNNNSDTSSDDCEIVSVSLNNNGQLLSKYRKIDVPGDNSCLFWAVTLAYLTPVKDDHNVFKTRFQKLFGHQNQLSTIQKCIQKYDHNIPNNDIFKNLVTQDFRNMVCDYIADNKKRFNFQDPLFNKSSNDELNYKELESHIQQMRKTTTWGTCLEQEAMALMLACNIHTYSNAQTHQVYPIVNKKTYDDKLILHFVNAETKNYDTKSANHFMFSLLNNSYILEHINDKQADSDDAVSSVIEVDLESSNSEIKSQLGNDNESKASNIVPLLFPEPTNECDVFDIHNHSIFKYYSKLAINAKISNLSSLGTTSRPYYSKDYITLIKHYLKLGFLDSAFELYSVLGKYYTDFDSEEIELSIGKMYARIGKYSKAREYYNKITDSDLIDKAKILIGNSFFQENKYDDAIEYYQKIPESYTKSQSMLDLKRYCQSRINIGNSYLKKSNYEVARYYYDIVSNRLAEDDNDYYSIYNKAQIGNAYTWLKKGDHQSAQKYYDKIKQIDYDDVIVFVGNILIKNNKYAQAREWLEQINENSPYYAQSQILIGNIFFYEGKYLQAREHYDNIQEKRKGEYYYCMAQINIGRSFIKENKFEEAKKYFNEIPSSSYFYKLDSKSSDTEAPCFINPYSKFKSYKYDIKDKLLCDQVVEFIKRVKSNDAEDISDSGDKIYDNYKLLHDAVNNEDIIDNSNSEQENDQEESIDSEEEYAKNISENEENNIDRISPNNDGTIAISSTESTEYILSRNKKALDVLINDVKNYSPKLSELWKSLSPEIGNQPIYKKLEAFFLDPLHILQVNTDKKQEQNVPDKQKDQAQIGLSKSCNISNTSIPPNFVEGKADNNGDCFFDAIAQALKQIKPEIDCSIKSLRKTCHEFITQTKTKWFQEIKESINDDIPRIQFTAADIATNTDPAISILNLKEPIWGRPEIEGRIICEKYNVRLHVQELHNIEGKIIFIDQIIDQCDSKTTDIDYTQNDVIHIRNNGKFHFIPLLRHNNNDVELTTNQNSNQQKEVGLSNDQMVDKEKHITIKRVLNFEELVSKTTYLTESSEKIEKGKAHTISSIQDCTLSSNNSTQKNHNTLIVHKNTVTREEFGTQYDVPGDGNCLFWSIFYAYFLPVRNSNKEFKERFKKMFPDHDYNSLQDVQNKFQSLRLNDLNNSQNVEAFKVLIQQLRKKAYEEVEVSVDKDNIHVTPSKNKKEYKKWAKEMQHPIILSQEYWGEVKGLNALAHLLSIKIDVYVDQYIKQSHPINLYTPLVHGNEKDGYRLETNSDITIILSLKNNHYNFYYKDIPWDKVDNNLDDTYASKMEDTVKIILSEHNYSRKEESTYDEFDNNGKTIAANSHKREQKSDQEENTCTVIEVYRSKHFNNDFHDFANEKYKSLHDVVRAGDISAVTTLLTKGVYVNALDQNNWTALHYAAKDGYDNVVKLLLDHGANVNVITPDDWTALHYAAENGYEKIVKLLLDHGANVNVITPDDWTALHYAAENGYEKIVKLLLDHGANVNVITPDDWTALHYAAENGYEKIVKLLLDHGVKVDATTTDGFTALHYAAKNKHIAVIQVLLKKEADINIADNDGYTPAHYLKYLEYLKLEGLNIDHLNLNTDINNVNNICLAAQNGDILAVNYLLTKNTDVNTPDHMKNTALHYAAREGHDDIVKLLLDHGAKVDAKTSKNWTALHFAAKNGYDNVVEILLDYGANINASFGSTALHLAAKNKHIAVIQVLLKKEADINIADNDGYTPLHLIHFKIYHRALTEEKQNKSYTDKIESCFKEIILKRKILCIRLDDQNDLIYLHVMQQVHIQAQQLPLIQKRFHHNTPLDITHYNIPLDIQYSEIIQQTAIKVHLKDKKILLYLAAEAGNSSIIIDLLNKKIVNVDDLNPNNWTALHFAARSGHDNIVKLLLDHGANVNVITPDDGWTALHFAARNGYDGIVEVLLKHNADIINIQTSFGSTALHLAAKNKHIAVIQVLLKKEADINIADNDGYTPAHYLKYLEYLKLEGLNIDHLNLNTDINNVNNICLAAQNGDISAVNYLLTKNTDVNTPDHTKQTALHYAARNGHDDIVKLLLDHGANVNVITPDYGWTALHLAARNGYDGIVEVLLKHNADIINIQTSFGSTALHLAAKNKHIAVIQVLLKKEADINIADNDGYTPAHYLKYLEYLKLEGLNIDHLNLNTDINNVNNICLAAQNGDISAVNYLLTKNTDVNTPDHTKQTALHYAARNGHDDIVKLLLDHGANVNVITPDDGWTALHFAARNGYDGIVEVLLKHNADIINIQTSFGSTALHLAAKNKHMAVIQVLLKKEADINIANNDGYTPAHYLKYLEYLKLEGLNIDHLNLNTDINNVNNICLAAQNGDISTVNYLLTKNTDVNTLDHTKQTALHYAARNGHDDIVKLLLDHGANVNVITPDDGWTALHFAARNGYDGIVEVLLKHNADIINIQTSCGSTALHLAAKNKHIAVIQVLLKKEADININDNNGNTPYSLALIQYYHPEIINLFQLKQQISKTKLLHTDYTEGLGNCFFHAVFGEKNSQSKLYEAEKAKEMREEWYNFLKQFEAQGLQDSNMPAALKDQLKKVFQCFLDNSTDFTSISDEIKVLVDNTNQAIIKAKYEIEELRNEITQKFQDDEEFRNEIHQIISQAREKTGQQAPNIQELLNDNMSLTNEISNALEECVLKFNSNLNHKTYSDQYNAQVIVDSFLDNPEVYSNYLEAIKQNSYYVFFEEIPILSSLANIKIQVYYDNGNEQKTIQCDPQQELRDSYPLKPEVWGNKEKAIISHSGMHFKHTSFSDFQQPALHEKQNLNAYMHTQDEKIVDIFYKKIKKYKFEKWNIDIEIREVQHSYFLIEELHLKRICTKNEGNHILPVSTICNLIKKFIEISKKNPVNDYIKVAEKLLSTFISNTHIHDEIQTYYNHLRDMMLNKKREKLSTINDLKVFLEHNLIPFILYVWDNRITSNFYEKRTKKALGQEGANIKLVNQKIMTLFNNENSDLQQYQVQMKSIREALLSTIDLPIIITHGLEELRQDDIDKYFNCIMLFLVKNLIVTIKNGTYANTLLYMEELNASIKSLKNLDNDSPLKDLQKIVGISNEQSTLDIEHTIEKIKSHGKLNNSIFNIIRILEAIHIENNINEVLQDQNLHFIYGMYISFIEKKDKSNLIKIRDNVESYKQKLESEPSNAVNDKYVLELTTIFEIIKVWNEYNVDVRLGDNEQQSVRNIVKEYLDSIAYDIVKLLHICTSIIECTSISHYEFNSEYTNIRNNLLKITSCGKELIEHHSNDISNLRRGMLKKICEELSDNDYSVYLSSDTGSVQDNHDLSNDDIAELQDMSCSQLLSLLQSSASYSSDDIMTIMQHKWKEEDLKVFLDKDALLEAVKNKPIQYVIFIQKDDKSELVHDARIIITESNGQVIEIPIVVQDKNNIKSFFDGSELAEYNTNSYNNHYISLPLMFNEIVNKLFYALDKPEMNKNITNVLTIYSDLPYYENSVINIFCKKVESYMKQINYFLQKLHKGESNYDCYNEFSTYLKENSGTQIMGKTIEQYYNHYIKINLGFIKALKLNSIIQYCNKHSGLENVQDFIKRIQTTLKENVYKGIDYVEAMGLDLESIRHNIHMINQDINQTVVDIDDNRMKLLFNNINCLKILGIKNYQDGNHAIVFVKNTNGVSIIDPLNKNSSFSNSLEKLANNLLSLGIKFINIIYSGLQQPNSGVCADISLILVKNLADKLPDVQSVQDIIEIIQDIRIKMYGKASEKNQEAITIKSFDAINTLTKLDSCAVGIQDKEKQQDNYYANNEFINTLQQDGFLIKPVELIGNVL